MDNENPHARLYYLFGATSPTPRLPWLARFPAEIFAIPVGLLSLVNAWSQAGTYGWRIATDVASVLIWPTTAIWILALLLYAAKCRRYPGMVAQESRHPVQSSLQALLPLSVLLAVTFFGRPEQGIWLVFAMLAIGSLAFIVFRIGIVLATGQMPRNAVTPALYLPFVGSALAGAMAFASLRHSGWSALLFGTGLSGWALLEIRILRNQFAGPMPEALRSTIGTELMPPMVATLTATMLWPDLPDDVLLVGIGVGLVSLVSVLARYRQWSTVPFSIGLWSFSFPLAAFAGVAIEMVRRGAWPLWAGQGVLLTVSVVIALLCVRTMLLLTRGKILPVG